MSVRSISWSPPKPDTLSCDKCDGELSPLELAVSWQSAVDRILSVAGDLGPWPMRLDICSCTMSSCSPCGTGGCSGTVLDLGGHDLNIDEVGCCYYNDAGELIEDETTSRPPLLAANICGIVRELVYGTEWVYENGCIRILCDVPGLRAAARGQVGPEYVWDPVASVWKLLSAGCPDTLVLYGMFGKTLSAVQWACLNDLVCYEYEIKFTDCEQAADNAESVRFTGPDGSTEYRFGKSPYKDEPWATGDRAIDQALYECRADDFVALAVCKPSTSTRYRVHATKIA